MTDDGEHYRGLQNVTHNDELEELVEEWRGRAIGMERDPVWNTPYAQEHLRVAANELEALIEDD